MVRTAAPELGLKIVAAPETLVVGSEVEITGRRWGITHRARTEIIALDAPRLLVEVQRKGTLKSWTARHAFEERQTSTWLTTTIDFEPPGGLLGLTVTAKKVLHELEQLFTHRNQRLQQLFAAESANRAENKNL